jgi:ABC-type transport system involved in multi-copper enzyme maturation permease subunit
MRAVLRAELVKVRTTRTAFSLILGAIVVAALGAASLTLSQRADQLAGSLHGQQYFYVTSIVVSAFAVILGIRSFTDEFTFGSIVPTFTLAPRRGTVLAAKAVTSATGGGVLALLAAAVMVLVALALGVAKGARPALEGTDAAALGGLVVAGALWAVIGVGIGAAARHQIAAIVGAIVWIVIVETAASGFLGEAASFLPGHAGHALARASAGPDIGSPLFGAILLGLYAAVALFLGRVFLRRDVEAAA